MACPNHSPDILHMWRTIFCAVGGAIVSVAWFILSWAPVFGGTAQEYFMKWFAWWDIWSEIDHVPLYMMNYEFWDSELKSILSCNEISCWLVSRSAGQSECSIGRKISTTRQKGSLKRESKCTNPKNLKVCQEMGKTSRMTKVLAISKYHIWCAYTLQVLPSWHLRICAAFATICQGFHCICPGSWQFCQL